MINQSLIPETLKDFKYYRNKLPLYLKNSKSFQEHFRIWYEVLVGNGKTGIVGNGEIFLNLLNIFDPDYLDFLRSIDDTEGATFDILDKIADLFGVNRHITVSYINENHEEINNEEITLSDTELLILIKARIIQNYCEGTREQIQKFYDTLGLSDEATGLTIKMLSNGGVDLNDMAIVDMYLIYQEQKPFSNIDKMFLSGMLTIESMGIGYRYTQPLVPNTILMWAREDEEPVSSSNVTDFYIYDDTEEEYVQATTYNKNTTYYSYDSESGKYIKAINIDYCWGVSEQYEGGRWII